MATEAKLSSLRLGPVWSRRIGNRPISEAETVLREFRNKLPDTIRMKLESEIVATAARMAATAAAVQSTAKTATPEAARATAKEAVPAHDKTLKIAVAIALIENHPRPGTENPRVIAEQVNELWQHLGLDA